MSKTDKMVSNLAIIRHLLGKVPIKYHLKLDTCWNVIKTSPRWGFENRYIRDYFLLFIRGGHGHAILDEHEFELKRGQVLFVGGGTCNTTKTDPSNPMSFVPLRFNFYSNDSGNELKPPAENLYYTYNSINADMLDFLFIEVNRLHSHESNSFIESNISSLLHALLCRSLYEVTEATDYKSNSGLGKIREWMKVHPLDRSTVEILAKKAGISKKYLTTLFKYHYGISPKSYQVSLRMNYAKYLLQESDCSIKEIASQLGYTDQYIFSKQFKNFIGYAPSNIRNV